MQTQQHLSLPPRIEAHPTFFSFRSFMQYVEMFQDQKSVIFADESVFSFKAVLNYHQANTPNWCSHQATYDLEQSDSWSKWWQCHEESHSPQRMIAFIKARLDDFVSPSAEVLLEVLHKLCSDNTPVLPKSFSLWLAPFTDSEPVSVKGYWVKEIDALGQVSVYFTIPEFAAATRRSFYSVLAKLQYELGDITVFEATDGVQ